MLVNDPIADMLTRIRNALIARHDTVTMPASNMTKAIAAIPVSYTHLDVYKRQILTCALCGALALSANGLGAVWLFPALPMWYFELDPLRLWMLFFGYFLAHVLWQAWRRRKAN